MDAISQADLQRLIDVILDGSGQSKLRWLVAIVLFLGSLGLNKIWIAYNNRKQALRRAEQLVLDEQSGGKKENQSMSSALQSAEEATKKALEAIENLKEASKKPRPPKPD